ncbi:chitosanase [Streptomyces sp. NPDC051561]|uniref:chitosanase n=1 Tax=Streptomyces sp. NPDC051561 TaxID=3365658 RepID=UPI003788E4B4
MRVLGPIAAVSVLVGCVGVDTGGGKGGGGSAGSVLPSGISSAVSSVAPTPVRPSPKASTARPVDLDAPAKKEIAMQLISSAENSSLRWREQYRYIQDIGDGRGYTAGIVGFCSGTGDMLKVVERYTAARPGNILEEFLPALRAVRGTESHEGLGEDFTGTWQEAADTDPLFRAAQDTQRDREYFAPAVRQGKADGVGALGQFVYFDAFVMHGLGDSPNSTGFATLRARARQRAALPAEGGDEKAYLNAFLDVRADSMRRERSHGDISRVETAQRVFVRAGNLTLAPPLRWRVYGDSYRIG